MPVIELSGNVTDPVTGTVNAPIGTVIVLRAVPPDTLLFFQTATEPPTVDWIVPDVSLNIVFASAPSNHNVQPAIEVGSKFQIFFLKTYCAIS
jgi:hypothetical protein